MGSLRQAQWCMWCATRMTARAALGKSSEALAVIDVVAGRFHELRQGDQAGHHSIVVVPNPARLYLTLVTLVPLNHTH